MLEAGVGRGVDIEQMLARARNRLQMSEQFVDAYRRHCWKVQTVDDLKVAPFQVLARRGPFLR